MTDIIQAAMIVICLLVAWLVTRPEDKAEGCQDCDDEECDPNCNYEDR